MFQYKILLLNNKKNKEGQSPVVLQLRKSGKRAIKNLDIFTTEKYWDQEASRFFDKSKNARLQNQYIDGIEQKVLDARNVLADQDYELSLKEIIKAIFEGIKSISVFELLADIIEEKLNANKKSSAQDFISLEKNLDKFSEEQEIYLREINYAFLKKFESFLLNETKWTVKNGVKVNVPVRTQGGIFYTFKTLRTAMNEAIKRDLMSQDDYPFYNNMNPNGFQFSHYRRSARPRAFDLDVMERWKAFDIESYPELKESYLYFMFSYYARGMNFMDMAKLKHANIISDRINYVRSKTGKNIELAYHSKLKDVLTKLEPSKTEYVLPIIPQGEWTVGQIESKIKTALKRCNQDLKVIAGVVGVEDNVTFYHARHTYATTLKFKGQDVALISEALGHADITTTQVYLKKFDTSIVDQSDDLL